MIRKVVATLAICGLTGAAMAVPSGISVTPTWTGNAYDLSGNLVVGPNPAVSQASTFLYEFELKVSISGLAASEDLVFVGVVPTFSGGVSNGSAVFGSDTFFNNPNVDPSPTGPANGASAPIFSNVNRNAQSLSVFVTQPSGANFGKYAAAEQFGEAAGVNALGEPSVIATFYAIWDGQTSGVLSFEAPQAGAWLQVLGNNTTGTGTSANLSSFTGSSVPLANNDFDFGVVPEPASVALLGLGSLLIGVRRRTA